jgi:hypothetical protein
VSVHQHTLVLVIFNHAAYIRLVDDVHYVE